MTPDDLRALADALPEGVHWSDPITPEMLAEAIKRFCADAQPVAWIAHNLTTGHVKWTTDRCRARGWTRSVNLRVKPLYAHPAPAAPQDEPKREPLSDERIELPDYLRLQIAGTAAAHDVLAERRRQIKVEGWTPEHDDKHGSGEMAAAAATYALHTIGLYHDCTVDLPPDPWPWAFDWWKPGDRRRNLVKAGALILAEIERLDRMGGSDAE